MQFTEHPGRHVADIELFALSTCPYCNATKKFLNEHGIEYKYVNIDQQTIPEAREIEATVLKYNPQDSYPTIVINNGQEVIVGFQKDKLEQLIGAENTPATTVEHRGEPFTEHPGRKVADIEIYSLSTCPYCNATKQYLNEHHIDYKYVNVDQQPEEEAEKLEQEVLKYNPEDTYPTVVVNGGQEVIIGYQPDKLAQLIRA